MWPSGKRSTSRCSKLQEDLDRFVGFYNEQRSHQGYRTQGRTPWQTFQDGLARVEQPAARVR